MYGRCWVFGGQQSLDAAKSTLLFAKLYHISIPTRVTSFICYSTSASSPSSLSLYNCLRRRWTHFQSNSRNNVTQRLVCMCVSHENIETSRNDPQIPGGFICYADIRGRLSSIDVCLFHSLTTFNVSESNRKIVCN